MLKVISIIFALFVQLNASGLYLVGNDGQLKGCISCNEYSGDSIWNNFSTYGNEFNSESLWNDFGTYGNEFNSNSPWNQYGQGMKIVDLDGNFYGYFTINSYSNQTRVPLLKSILDAFVSNKWKSKEAFRKWVAPKIQ